MSELTPCCFCSLRAIKRRYGEGRVTTQPCTDAGREGWTDVLVDGRRIACMQQITDGCVC